MNIFITSLNPEICAAQHCDIHLRKMIVETAQLLSTAHVMIDGVQVAYKKTHHNHPCAVWVRECRANYVWTSNLLINLLDEYRYRFRKSHATNRHAMALMCPPLGIPYREHKTSPAQAMPEEFRRPGDPEMAYQEYLISKFTEWQSRDRKVPVTFTRRSVPQFLQKYQIGISK